MKGVYVDPQVGEVRKLHRDLLETGYTQVVIRDRLAALADSVLSGHLSGNPAVTFHLGSWCKEFIGMETPKILSRSLTLDQARQAIAAEHGYKDWSQVEALGNLLFDETYESAVDALLLGNIEGLRDLVNISPDLTQRRSRYAHRATLLHYIGANGVESYRQVTPLNAPEMVEYLIEAGADVNAEANIYGGGSTPLDLVQTSAHPYNAGVLDSIVLVLKTAGAS